jgi:arylsulfatase A-like enzyme
MNRLIAFLLLITGCAAAQSKKPNIIYIMTDDMGYGDLSCYGQKNYTTPNLDKLASQGMKFVNAYSAAPVCTPTRVAFVTGRYPARTPAGLMEPLTGRKDSIYGITREIPSIGLQMKAAGYETALIGKWHLGFQKRHNPTQNGFDFFYGIKSGAVDYVSHKGDPGRHDLFENDVEAHEEGYFTDLMTKKTTAFISKKHEKPFFLAVMYTAPHWPWQAPGDPPYPDSVDWTAGGSASTYAAMMKSLDNGIGELLKTLDDAGLSNNTIVIFTNDNGGERYSDMGGLSKSKMTLWEGGIRVPAFVRWPGKIKAGSITEQVIVTMDWTATILKAGGAKTNSAFAPDGIDLMPTLRGNKKLVDRTLYWRTFQRTQFKAVRMGNWKYLWDGNEEYLFDLAKDHTEKVNLKNSNKEIMERLKAQYADWEKSVLSPIPL